MLRADASFSTVEPCSFPTFFRHMSKHPLQQDLSPLYHHQHDVQVEVLVLMQMHPVWALQAVTNTEHSFHTHPVR